MPDRRLAEYSLLNGFSNYNQARGNTHNTIMILVDQVLMLHVAKEHKFGIFCITNLRHLRHYMFLLMRWLPLSEPHEISDDFHLIF